MFWRKKSPEAEPPPTFRERVAVAFLQLRFIVYLVLVLSLMLVGFVWKRVFITVPAGHSAVMYRFLGGGTVTDHAWGEGLHVIPPWDRLTLYDTRLQQRTIEFDVLSEEGLRLGAKVSVRYRADVAILGFLQRDVGPDYFDKLILPEVQAHTRRTFGDRTAEEIFSSERDVLQELGRVPVLGRMGTGNGVGATPYVQVQELKLMDIILPTMVAGAIADKYRQEQLMLEYRYKLEREEKEAERKRTEAAGIRDYNEIVGKLSPEMLKLRSIEATLELSKSPNSKVLLLGGGSGQGQPPSLIMNLEGPATAPLAATPVEVPPAPPNRETRVLPPAADKTATTTLTPGVPKPEQEAAEENQAAAPTPEGPPEEALEEEDPIIGSEEAQPPPAAAFQRSTNPGSADPSSRGGS